MFTEVEALLQALNLALRQSRPLLHQLQPRRLGLLLVDRPIDTLGDLIPDLGRQVHQLRAP